MNHIRRLQQIAKTIIAVFKTAYKPYVYVAIGDSAAEGKGASSKERTYPAIIFSTIKRNKRNAKYYNFAKSGAPVQEIIQTQLEKTINLKPNFITISVGANDLRLRTRPKIFEERLRFLLSELKEKTNAVIVINTIPDFSNTPRIPKYLKQVSKFAIKHFNKIIKKVSQERGIIIVDLFDQSSYYLKHYPEAISSDGFHPSDFGYALWANTILHSVRHLFNNKISYLPINQKLS